MIEEYSMNKTGYLFKENSPEDLTYEDKQVSPLLAVELDEDFYGSGHQDRI